MALVPVQGDDQPSSAEAPTLDALAQPPKPSEKSDDSFDEILRKVVQSGAAREMLAAGSELAGRFTITRVLGEGGMGTVYVARDATLGREVAIKVHHAAGGARRLRREAVAMARLAHPNVVTVFEVGELSGRPFVVMEYVPGTTLRAWLATAPRGVREILAMVIAAGEGLAAAHDAGLVHRDIKPENVLVGVDGRARVGDFGLARELDSKEEVSIEPSASVEDLRAPVTQTGSVMGTPAYMAPEQFAGAPVDARADQFAFCVTAWEALWGERPFAGSSLVQLHTAILQGARRSPPPTPKVPARVRAALERGLSVAPADRFATMHALLGAMRPPARRRARGFVAGGAIAVAGLAAVIVMHGTAGPSCDAAGIAELSAVRTDLPARLRQHGADRIAAQADTVQEGYVTAFRKNAHAACDAGRAHDWSRDIIAKSQACFAIVARTAALSLAGVDPARPMEVLRHLRRLPPADQCRNQTHLGSLPPLPSDPQQQEELIEAEATLAVGFDSAEDHDFPQLRRALDKLAASPAKSDPGIVAGMIILRGWLAEDGGKPDETRKLFTDAYYAGRAVDDDQISSTALMLLIQHSTRLGVPPAPLKEWLRTALADADRIRARSPWLAGRIYTVAAHAADLGEDAEAALTFVARAREVLGRGDPFYIQTYAVEGAVKIWSGHIDDGIKAYGLAISQKIASVGPDDPEVAALYSDYAALLVQVERLEPALEAANHATGIIAHLADPDDDRIEPIRVNLAAALIGLNRDDEALGLLQTARANNVRRLGETNTIIANIDSNLAIIYNDRGQYDQAIAALEAALAIEQKVGSGDDIEFANILYNLAAAYHFKKDYPATIATALRAARLVGAKTPGSDRHRLALTMAASAANDTGDSAQALDLTQTALGFAKPPESTETLAWIQVERARALIGKARAAEARPLLVTARAAYAGLHMTKRVEQIDALVAHLPR